MADYRPAVRKPLVTSYKDWQIIGFPPPSSGGVHVAQVLNMLENFPLRELHAEDPLQGTHLILESMKFAFADRAYWLGDADFADVPRGLISQAYADSLAKKINPAQTVQVSSHGTPPQATTDLFGKHTTHIAAADTEGYWVAITATVNTTFGSKVIVPGTGLVLNNEMDDFSSQPGTPNDFGLLGAQNNSIAPGKRPLSCMSPTIVCDFQGDPVMTVGAAGGPKIITQVVQAIINHLDYDMPLSAAVAAPRYHHQWSPDSVLVEETVSSKLIQGLKERGHAITTIDSSGVMQAITRDALEGLLGVSDPRVPGKVGQGVRH
jgi:gamma-glutamyltranspeptidase/glutathione hydrolase